jgi:hypothetical protein
MPHFSFPPHLLSALAIAGVAVGASACRAPKERGKFTLMLMVARDWKRTFDYVDHSPHISQKKKYLSLLQ